MVLEVPCPSAKGLSNEDQLTTKAITPFAEEQMQPDAQPYAKRERPI
jgi:hypothetical protein